MSSKHNHCRELVGEGISRHMCCRPLPCLIHTPYELDEPPTKPGPRMATFAERQDGRTCQNCLRCVEIHSSGGPTEYFHCQLHRQNLRPTATCDDFTVPPCKANP